jgi:phosphoribosylformylglycinamidine synthase
VDLEHERRLAALLAGAATDRLLTGSHDLSEGGLAQALVEASLVGGRGAEVSLPAPGVVDPFVTLFAESAGRVLVTVAPEKAGELLDRAASANLPAQRLGTVGGDVLAIEGVPALPLDELRTAWEGTLPALFGA